MSNEEPHFSKKVLFSNFVLLYNAFVWYFMVLQVKDTTLFGLPQEQTFLINAGYFCAIICSSIIGSLLSSRIARDRILLSWMASGIIVSLLPMLALIHCGSEVILIVFLLMGITFGFGMPSCLAFFAEHLPIENRGRMGGLIFFAVSFSFVPIGALFGMLDSIVNLTIMAMWRLFGLLTFFLSCPKKQIAISSAPTTQQGWFTILRARSFILYFIPWSIFSLLDAFETIIIDNYLDPSFSSFLLKIDIITSALFVLVAGVLADWIGRKRVVIYGFVALGLAYAVIGLAPAIELSWYFYHLIDGVAAGIFMVTFVLLLWGDQSPPGLRERYYALGNIPFFAARIVGSPVMRYVMQVPALAAFSLASFFLFLAVLPLMYAPETLPEKKIELRRLRKYVEKAKEVREKHEEKESI